MHPGASCHLHQNANYSGPRLRALSIKLQLIMAYTGRPGLWVGWTIAACTDQATELSRNTSYPVSSQPQVTYKACVYLMPQQSHLETVLAENSALCISELVLSRVHSLTWLPTLLLPAGRSWKKGLPDHLFWQQPWVHTRTAYDSTGSGFSHTWYWSHQ